MTKLEKAILPLEYETYVFDLYGTLVDIHTEEEDEAFIGLETGAAKASLDIPSPRTATSPAAMIFRDKLLFINLIILKLYLQVLPDGNPASNKSYSHT